MLRTHLLRTHITRALAALALAAALGALNAPSGAPFSANRPATHLAAASATAASPDDGGSVIWGP